MDFSNNWNTIFVSDAVIEDISSNRDVRFVTISYNNCRECRNGNQQVVLVVDRNTVIRNDLGATISYRELEVGMVINAVISSAMTRSIPPQAQAFRIQIVNTA